MARTFVVVGLGTLGGELVKSLYEGGANVIAVDSDQASVNRIKDSASLAVCLDVTNEHALESAGLLDADVVILALRRHFDVTVLATYMFKSRSAAEIIAHVDSEQEGKAILAVGATSVVFPERDLARLLANRLLHPGLADHISLGGDVGVIEVACPPAYGGKSLADLDLRRRFSVNVIALKLPSTKRRGREKIEVVPSPEAPLPPNAILLLVGRIRELEAFRKEASEQPS